MKKILFAALAFAGLSLNLAAARGAVITEDFSANPLQNGWQVFGNTNLFVWDSTNRCLDVAWDSTQPNSYFYYPLDGYLTRNDDFRFEFDLLFTDIASNVEPGKTGPLQVAVGFENYANATNADYVRGLGEVADIAEVNYYPTGYYVFGNMVYPSPPTFAPAFVSDAQDFSPNFLSPYYDLEFPTNTLIHITMTYNADEQTAFVTATTNGIPIGFVPPLVLDSPTNSNFTNTDNYVVTMFSISSFTSIGDPYDSLLAHGTIANLQITLPPPAQCLAGSFSNGIWQVQFNDKTNWLYTLERTTNFISWSDASGAVPGNGTNMVLQDPEPPPKSAFYRVRANRP